MHTHKSQWDLFPFEDYRSADYKPLILDKLEKAHQDIESVIQQSAEPSFSNTILRLENNNHIFSRIVDIFFNLNAACTDDIIQKDAHTIAEKLSAYSNYINLNEALFQRVKTVYNESFIQSNEDLDEESRKLLENTYISFVRNGALLSDTDKEQIRQIDQELSKLTLTFSDNVLAETNNDWLHVPDRQSLSGIPEEHLEYYRHTAASQKQEGYIITLHAPSYIPFMKYCSNRSLRAELYQKYMTRGSKNNEHNNIHVIQSILKLRFRRARILGFSSHSEYVLARRMAATPMRVSNFLEDIYAKAIPFARKDADTIREVAEETDGISDIQAYDHAYYAEILKNRLHNYSDEILRPYFSLEDTIQSVFSLSNKLFGLEFNKIEGASAYHPDTDVYEVLEKGSFKAILYTDFFPRANKKPGAWMTVYKNQRMEGPLNIRPHVSIVCNFTPAQDGKPSLLTFDEVTTLYHEFGHAIHGMMAETQYESMSGTNVFWDFVELPSQFMENFCYDTTFLQSWAKHYQTGEPIPEALVHKITASSQFMEAYQTIRQLAFGILDLTYYSKDPETIGDLMAFERKTLDKTQLYPWYKDSMLSTSFAHIFGGGYDSGYYSYKWAEVLDADAYAYLKQKDFAAEPLNRFRYLLSAGGTVDPMTLYRTFREQDPDISALLKRAGIA